MYIHIISINTYISIFIHRTVAPTHVWSQKTCHIDWGVYFGRDPHILHIKSAKISGGHQGNMDHISLFVFLFCWPTKTRADSRPRTLKNCLSMPNWRIPIGVGPENAQELTFIELFAGEGNCWKAVGAVDESSCGIDIAYLTNHDGYNTNPFDICSPSGLPSLSIWKGENKGYI